MKKSRLRKRREQPRKIIVKLLLAVVFLAIGGYALFDYLGWEENSIHASGTIVDVSKHTRRTGRRGGRVATLIARVKFTPEGYKSPITVRAVDEIPTRYKAGEVVDITYDSKRPDHTLRVETGLPIPDLIFGILGIFLMLKVIIDVKFNRELLNATSTCDEI